MKPLLLALVLSGTLDAPTLEIGLDVLPEVFSFAARRVGFAPVLHLSKCTQATCFWDIGQGVEVTANHRVNSIVITRIEAKLRPRGSIAPETLRQYEKACLTIVALVYRDGGAAKQRATAKAIAAPTGAEPGVQLELPERNITFYGTRSASMTQDKQDVVLRCGATSAS